MDCDVRANAQAGGVVTIDLDALARNYARLRAGAAPAECGAVVKANAYGLGVEPVARRLHREGCRRFFVATLAEALALREVLSDAAIYVFEGPVEGAVEDLAAARLTPVLNSMEQVELWLHTGCPAVLHLDTGMTRLGLDDAAAEALAQRPRVLERLDVEFVMTHLACADEPGHALNVDQIERFEQMRRHLPWKKTSVGNSACALTGVSHAGDLLRPGIGLYGGNPFVAQPNPFEPVVTLEARIVQVHDVDRERTVGYGATYDTGPPARLAIVGVGYADGYPRCLGGRGSGFLDGLRVPLVGRVSMDMLCLDVSALPRDAVRVGRLVELVGSHLPLDEVAEAADTIAYEILTRFGGRLQRRYTGRD